MVAAAFRVLRRRGGASGGLAARRHGGGGCGEASFACCAEGVFSEAAYCGRT